MKTLVLKLKKILWKRQRNILAIQSMYADLVFKLELLNGREFPLIRFKPESRHIMYKKIIEQFDLQDKRITYLEFGVWRGKSFKYWCNNNTNPSSNFFGFDTFTGVEEDWMRASAGRKSMKKFDMAGSPPKISDPRAKLIKGLFQMTLPGFVKKNKPLGQLIVHIDSDLYSSALFVLTKLDEIMPAGTIIIFDEFAASNTQHEALAFYDYIRSYHRNFEPIIARQDYKAAAIRLI